jgi:hypothetical protein
MTASVVTTIESYGLAGEQTAQKPTGFSSFNQALSSILE